VFAVFDALRLDVDAFDAGFLELDHVGFDRRWREISIAVHAQKLHALHDSGAHLYAVRNAAGVAEVGRRVVDDEVGCVD
jgi:hypothetical protein